jgi:hypothetical protein
MEGVSNLLRVLGYLRLGGFCLHWQLCFLLEESTKSIIDDMKWLNVEIGIPDYLV